VFVHEDDWGRHSLEVRENIGAQVRSITAAPTIPLAIRKLTLVSLREVLGSSAYELGGVRCGGDVVTNGFAFACGRLERNVDDDWNVLYGIAKDDHVLQLHLTFGTPALAHLLHQLGTTFGLILFSGRDVVDLAVRLAIDHYLTPTN